ncbi:hypothetical protein FNF29_03865 [Cafeteria roenbergensis]|nr:hypothetical protein FNF29_03865 [Cafeteria roenbergensis]|eukprot:KAA0152638.1 hypothetical protein FNF29_03865 [Cafeteria roenbergensis]
MLSLDGNHIGDGGATALAGGLRSNATLLRLAMCENGIGEPGVAALHDCLVANRVLTELFLTRNPGMPYGSSVSDDVQDLLERNADRAANWDARRLVVLARCASETARARA